MGDAPSRKPQTDAGKLRQLSELQASNLKTILEEADAQREFTAECVQGFCALLDKFTAMREAMKSLRKQYLHAKARLLTFEREAEIAATLPDDPGADLAEHKPPESETTHDG